MPTTSTNGQVLTTTETISSTFSIANESWIILRGTVNGTWMVESRILDDPTNTWEQDGATQQATVKKIKWEGVKGLEYRINLGSGNQGPTGYVYPASVTVWS